MFIAVDEVGPRCTLFYGLLKGHQSQITLCEKLLNNGVYATLEHGALQRAIQWIEIIYRTLIRKQVLRAVHSILTTHSKHPHPNRKANLVNLLQ